MALSRLARRFGGERLQQGVSHERAGGPAGDGVEHFEVNTVAAAVEIPDPEGIEDYAFELEGEGVRRWSAQHAGETQAGEGFAHEFQCRRFGEGKLEPSRVRGWAGEGQGFIVCDLHLLRVAVDEEPQAPIGC
jgi:hypothetical protein